ncbi:hypothetical protein B9T62_05390 [Paenibacillus donghaensis]|uniref:Hint domain-containing protein n=1 Tax=Paenibacillus donghaensis TaxID=414771 RepID=A0A2Z2KKA2_9BACL|nr:hypothetical protein B9T62_05390 [Paenibacillus donghaensis]
MNLKSNTLRFKLFIIFLCLAIVLPNLSTDYSLPTVQAQESGQPANSLTSLLEEPKEPSASSSYPAPDVNYEPQITHEYLLDEDLNRNNLSRALNQKILEVPEVTWETKVEVIKQKYAKSQARARGLMSTSAKLEPIALSTEDIKKLMELGANIEDIYELAYLSSEQQMEPFELYQKKVEYKGSWDLFRQSLPTSDLARVTETVYSTDLAPLPIQELSVADSVYSVTQTVYDQLLGKRFKGTILTSLDYNISSVFNDFQMEVINQTAKPQFSDRSLSSETVDPSSGSLTWKDTQISLPGRDGLDLNIGVMFNANQAQLIDPQVGAYNFNNRRYDLGTGWSFRFPSVERDNYGNISYHDGQGAIYNVTDFSENELENYTHLKGYKGKDMRFVFDAAQTFNSGQYGSDYYLEYADGKREYFGGYDNVLLGIKDRFGNVITFKYEGKPSDHGAQLLLSEINDSLGRKVLFEYDYIKNARLERNQETPEERITVTVLKASGEKSEHVTYTRKRVTYALSRVYPGGYADLTYPGIAVPVLTSITRQNGEKTQFSHSVGNFFYNTQLKEFKPWDSYTEDTAYIKLLEVKYPHSLTKYNYEYGKRNYGYYGAMVTEYVSSRYDQIIKSGAFTGEYNKVEYSRNGSYDAYPVYYEQGKYPAEFTYSTAASQKTSSGNIDTKYTFNGKGQLLSTEQTARNGEKTVIRNSAFHPLYSQSPTLSESLDFGAGDNDSTANKLYSDFTYDEWGNIASATQPLTESQRNNPGLKQKYTTSYSYEPNFRFISGKSWYQNENDAAPSSESYTYTAQGRVNSFTNPLGEVSSYTYENAPDGSGKLHRITETKTSAGQLVAKTVTVLGAETGYAYPTEQQQYFNVNQPNEQAVRKTIRYDMASGRVLEERDGNDRVTAYQYDALGRTQKVTYPNTTNDLGVIYSEVDEINYYNNTGHHEFDAENAGTSTLKVDTVKTITQVSTGANIKTYRNTLYNGFGLALMEEQWDEYSGKWTHSEYHYDNYGRPIYAADPAGNITTVGYDAWGRQNRAVDPFGNIYVSDSSLKQRHSISYLIDVRTNEKLNYVEEYNDQWGNQTSKRTFKTWPQTSAPIGESYRYDLLGNVTAYTDPNQNLNNEGVTISYRYDRLNRLISLKDALNQTSAYGYDGNGQIISSTIQAAGGSPQTINTKTYNELGLQTIKRDAASLNETQHYNNLGLVQQKTDRMGTVSDYRYDERSQLKSASYKGTVNGVAQTQEKRLIFGDGGPRYQTSQTYMNGGQSASRTLYIDSFGRARQKTERVGSHSSIIRTGYNILGQVTEVNDDYLAFNTQYKYNKLRLDQVQTNGNGVVNNSAAVNVQYQYTGSGQVASLTYPTLTDSSLLKTEYQYKKALGWVESVTNWKGSTVLSKSEYEYDNNGNITKSIETRKDQATETSSYTYDALNRLLIVTRADGSREAYTYDLRGNRLTLESKTSIEAAFAETTYGYDLLNTLTTLSQGGKTTHFTYYADGLRFKKVTGNSQTQYNYNLNGEVITEEKNSGQKANYVRGDRVLVKKDKTAGKDYYYLYNGHGDVVQIVDTSGKPVNTYSYDVWGNITNQTEGISNPFKYTGEIYDEETGLYYLRARYYDPSMGRFLNEDTVEGQITNPLSLNLYTYVGNNPLIYVDPSGNVWKWVGDGWKMVKSAAVAVANFMVVDDIRTIIDPNASTFDKSLAIAGFIPVGKFIKGGKIVVKLISKEGKVIERAVEKTVKNEKAIAKALGCNCFTAGTKVQTEDGEKPIEEIEVGDKVLSKSDVTGEVEYKEVVQLFQKQADEIYYVHIGDEVIETTGLHPFWLDGKGWTLVQYLKVGELLVSSNGTKLAIDKIEKAPRQATVYNFMVADYHSYFISNLGIWVHNCTIITAGKNFKDHFIRHKGILENALGTKYAKYKTHGDAFLNDIGKIIDDGTVKLVGKGTLKKDGEVLNIYKGNGMTVATKANGEFVTLIESGKGMDLNIQFK